MTRTISPFALAYSILAGPILWFIHFFVVYGIAEFGCRANFNNWLFYEPATIRLGIAATTVVILIAVLVSGVIAYRLSNQLSLEHEVTALAYTRFLVRMGLMLSVLFFVSIVVTAVPAFFLNVCDKAA